MALTPVTVARVPLVIETGDPPVLVPAVAEDPCDCCDPAGDLITNCADWTAWLSQFTNLTIDIDATLAFTTVPGAECNCDAIASFSRAGVALTDTSFICTIPVNNVEIGWQFSFRCRSGITFCPGEDTIDTIFALSLIQGIPPFRKTGRWGFDNSDHRYCTPFFASEELIRGPWTFTNMLWTGATTPFGGCLGISGSSATVTVNV